MLSPVTNPDVELIELTPLKAAEILRGNISNRPVRTAYVSRLAQAIRRGEWKLNGDAIRISKDGRVQDGQHRCYAVIQAEASIQTLLVTGLDNDVFDTIDKGIAKTAGDSFATCGEANFTTLASTTRLLYVYQRTGNPFNANADSAPTTKQQMQLLKENPSLRASASWISASNWCRRYLSPSLGGFCHFLFSKADKDAAKSFFDSLESGVGLEAGSPVLFLRNRLMEMPNSKERINKSYKAALVFKAFKLHRDGALIKTLRVRTEGDMPEKGIFTI